jgi:hypothetical protein
MEKVNSELEALQLCKEHTMKIEFRKDTNFNREFVVVTLGFKTVAGQTLLEAVNRLVEMYHTAPINHEKLEWYEENQKYLHGVR